MKLDHCFRTLAIALVATVLLAQLAPGASEKVEATYPLKPDGSVRVANVNGRIEIRAWDGDGVKLEATKEGRTAEIVAGIKVVTDSTPERLIIKTELAKVKRGWFLGTSHEGQVTYVLLVPAGATLEKIETVNGSVLIEKITGAVHATSVNGSIKGQSLAGTAKLETVNGSIHSTHTQLQPEGRLKASSVNGAIEVQLPAGLSAALEASTVNGSVQSDFAFTTTTRNSKRNIEARIGGGDARIELSAVNGGIRVREFRNEHAAAK